MGEKPRHPDASASTYVVRVYRVDQGRRSIVGVVETVGEEVKAAFTNVDELWGILTAGKVGPRAELCAVARGRGPTANG